ncbi:hypothetical protein ACHHYP_09895 [Achlya hypogyna]|uniref:RING-type domain-containing protein n=1 Tax=Achlya hypogyna TaxID=1202772 RepID=A0A1V9ZIN8_ACHHY|nr:hypothetical protein ACHHYP_09895 [Achlya hypogyna]
MLDAQKLADELQCAICLHPLFKPTTLTCGHSRLCLVDACAGQDECFASCMCPICREFIGFDVSKISVNVALWNVVRIVCPSTLCESAEELQFQRALKLAIEGGDVDPDEPQENDDDTFDEEVESDTYVIDGEARSILRGIVSVDGRSSIALGIVHFPGGLQTHCFDQDCTIAMLYSTAVDENEFPVVVSEIHEAWVQRRRVHQSMMTLTVLNRADEIVLERTAMPHDGLVTFPNLYVEGPSGEYAFRFYDLVTGASMEIKSSLRARRASISS